MKNIKYVKDVINPKNISILMAHCISHEICVNCDVIERVSGFQPVTKIFFHYLPANFHLNKIGTNIDYCCFFHVKQINQLHSTLKELTK